MDHGDGHGSRFNVQSLDVDCTRHIRLERAVDGRLAVTAPEPLNHSSWSASSAPCRSVSRPRPIRAG